MRMKMITSLVIIALIAVTALGLSGCDKGKGVEPNPKRLTIGIMPDVESIPFIIAEKNGYFKKQGVEVKLEHFKSAKDRDSALQSGKLDGVVTDIVAVVFANEGDINLKMTAKTDGNIQLLAGNASEIKSAGDLKGKSIGLSTNTIMEFTLDQMLAAASLTPEEVKKVAIPQIPTRLEMLQGGKVDAAIMVDPYASLGIKNGATLLNSTDRMANKSGVIAFTGKSLQENPNGVKAVFKAYNEAVAYLAQEPAASYIDFVIQSQGFPAEVKGVLTLPQYKQATLPEERIFLEAVKWLKGKNLIKGSYEYRSLVEESVLR